MLLTASHRRQHTSRVQSVHVDVVAEAIEVDFFLQCCYGSDDRGFARVVANCKGEVDRRGPRGYVDDASRFALAHGR